MSKNIIIIVLIVLFSTTLWIFVSLSGDFSTEINLPVRFYNVPEGFVPNSISTNKIDVKVKGSGWNILTTLLSPQKDYYVDAGKNVRNKNTLDLKSFAQENAWLTSKLQLLEVKPDTISFSFEKVGYAKLKIIPNLQIEFKSGYGLASEISVVPDSVFVSGPIHLVNSLSDILTEPLYLKDLDEKMIKAVELKKIPGLTLEETTVTIVLDVQRIVERDFENVAVSVTDIPMDRDVILLPNKITVQLRGGIDFLGKLVHDSIYASIPYRDIVLDTLGSIKPILALPKNTTLVSVKPERLNYVIKKFRK